MNRILVTGATGFIGTNLVRRLVELGNDVTILTRKNSDCSCFSNLNIKKIVGDILDIESVKSATKDCEFVYHLAALISFNRRDFNDLFNINVIGTKNVINSSLEFSIKKFVYISACAVFGVSDNKNKKLNEETVYNLTKNDAYAYTKKLAEQEVIKGAEKGLNAVIVNSATVYGKGDKHLNSGFVIKLIYSNKFLIVPPGGTSVVSIDDVVDGCILAMEKGIKGEKYILSNEMMEFTELYRIIANCLGKKIYISKLPEFLYYPSIIAVEILEKILELTGKSLLQITPEMIKSTFGFKYYDSYKAKEKLGWRPKVSFPIAVKQALDYYLKNKLI